MKNKMTKYVATGLLLLTCLTLKLNAASLYTYTNSGNNGLWNNASTWTTDPSGLSLTGSVVPGNNDFVYILNGFTVSLSANVTTTGLRITINNGGTLDLSTFTMATINTLSGAGTLRIGAGYFPAITTNNFLSSYAAGAAVEFSDFTGTLPVSINYPNLILSNSTASNSVITFSNTAAYNFTVFGNLTTLTTGTGQLAVTIGSQITKIINLTVNGNITTGNNTTLNTGVFNAIHSITVYGNWTNNGTIQLSNGTQYSTSSTGAATTSFKGSTDNILACNGVTNLYSLTVDKGSGSTNILSVTSTNVANFNFYTNGQLFLISNGTLRLGANIDIPRVYGTGSTNYDIGSSTTSPMLWIDGASVNTNSSALVVYGKFRISAGSFTTLGGQGSVIREEGQYIIEGGTFTTEKFRPSTTATTHRGSFTMTGGIVNAQGTATPGSDNNYARFSIPFPEQVFLMSGGIINVSNPQPSGGGAPNGGIHIGCKTSNYNVTGGTVNAILSGSATAFNIASTSPFWNLNITKTGGSPTKVLLTGIGSITNSVTTAQPLIVLNDFTIDGTNTPIFDANGLSVTLGKGFTINVGATYTPNSNATIFNGGVNQNFNNNGTITSGLYNMTVDKAGGAVILGGTATIYPVTQMLTINNGILNDGGKTILVTGDIYNDAIHTGTGNITLGGTSTQILSGDGNGVYGNLILNNTSTPGARATANLAVSGVLTLAGTGNSLFDIDLYLLSLTSTSAAALTTTGNAFGSAKMIRTSGYQSDRGVKKTFGDLSSFTFAFGYNNNYTPATIKLNAVPTTYGTITARPVNSRHQFIVAGNTNNLTWYWKVVSAGFTGLGATAVSHIYQYLESSVAPAGDDVNYIPARYNPTSWTVISDLTKVDEINNLIYFTNVGYIDGEFTAGMPASFGTVKVFYSKRSGNWTDVNPGTTPWSNVSYSGTDATTYPVVGDQVFIGDGNTFNHYITITANSQASGGLEINAGSTLDVGTYTGHNFGTFQNTKITGSGLLRISSATATAEFPAGDFGNFIRPSGGVVEYYTTGTTNFDVPLNSSAPTSLPLISYNDLLLTPGTGRFIAMPNQDLRIFNNMTLQGISATGVARLNAASSTTLTVNGNLNINSGNLQFRNGTAQTIFVDGNISIGSVGIFNLNNTGTAATNLLTLDGNIINNGLLDLSNTASYVCNVTFTNAANTSITGTGSTTDFNVITVSKGISQSSILNVNANAFSLSGTPSPLVLNTGTFRLTSTQSVTFSSGIDFSIPSSARLSANGGTLLLAGGDGVDLLLAGNVEVLNGAINIGTTANDNSIEYAATGQPTITSTGGSLNVNAQIRRSFASSQGSLIYNQSGTGVVSVGLNSATTTTRGVFEILNPGSSFSMAGGTLRIVSASGSASISDLYLQPASYTVTGGTIEFGTGATNQNIDVNAAIPVYNVTVTGSNTIAKLEFNGLTLRGSLSIESSTVFNANSLNVNVAGNFANSNLNSSTNVTSGGYQAGSVNQTTTINSPSANQNITGASGNLTNFGNLVINNTFAGGMVSLQLNSNLRVNGTLSLVNGILAGSDNTITAVSTVYNAATHTNTTGGTLLLAGSSNQFITGNGNGKFGNVTLSNASGASFGANQEITGTLTFTNGALTIGSYGLTLSNTSLTAIVGSTTTRYIITSGNLSDAGVTKAFAASVTSGNFVYPIGVSGKYTPANYTLSTGALGGTITVRPVNSKHPSATGSGTAFINYYWSVSSSVIILNSLTHTYTYVVADEAGNKLNYRDARFKGGAWTIGVTAGNPNTTTRIITFTNTDAAGDYTTGEATAFVNPTTYTSIGNGSWESDLSVWDIDPPGTNLGPPAGSFVIIDAGTIVTVTANSKRMATLEVRGRLQLGNTNGHDFGTVSTNGISERTIQIQSSTFPAGNFSNFNAANGGTIEYDGIVILPTQNTYNNLSFTSAGIKTLPNADLTLNGNFTILAGTVTNAINNRTILLTSTSGDFISNGVFNAGSGPVIIGRNLTNSGASAVFNGGTGTYGLQISGNLVNSSGATFTMNTDSVAVKGSLTNSATFTASAGALRVAGNMNNGAGTFTASSGIVAIGGSLTNNAGYTAGTGITTVKGSYTNSGAAAVHTANGNMLTVYGDLTNSASAVFNANTGSVIIGGNWSNTGSFNAGTGSVTFNGSLTQSLTGATAFYNITRSNGGALSLNNNISAGNILTLTSGNIITGTNTVSLSNITTQPVLGYSTSSYVDGKLIISYPNTDGENRVFPVGKGSRYRPVTIQQNATSSIPIIRVEMINTPPTGTFPPSTGVLSEARYYTIDRLSGTMNSPTITLSFNTNGSPDESIAVPGNVHILKSSAASGPWTDEGGSGVYSPAAPAGYATSGITSINPTTFFALGYQNVVLPITLGSFTASLNNDVVLLKWVTYSEENNDFFTIERSANGIQFDSISTVAGAGNSNRTLYYQQIDAYPLTGVSYYRLKQTDYDGKFTYSRIVTISNSSAGKKGMVVYPNPSQAGNPVFVKLPNVKGKAYMLVVDVTGRIFFSGDIDTSHETNVNELTLKSNFVSGIYFIRVVSDDFTDVRKLVIQ